MLNSFLYFYFFVKSYKSRWHTVQSFIFSDGFKQLFSWVCIQLFLWSCDKHYQSHCQNDNPCQNSDRTCLDISPLIWQIEGYFNVKLPLALSAAHEVAPDASHISCLPSRMISGMTAAPSTCNLISHVFPCQNRRCSPGELNCWCDTQGASFTGCSYQ